MSAVLTVDIEKTGKIAYTLAGTENGVPIVVLHGLVGSIETGMTAMVPDDFPIRFINVARPGYGTSSFYTLKNIAEWAEDFGVLVTKLGLDSFYIMGIEAGAPYAYALAEKYPQKVKQVFIASGIPALYKSRITAVYPKEMQIAFEKFKKDSLKQIAGQIQFVYVNEMPKEVQETKEVLDSTQHDCMAMAQESKLQVEYWGFRPEDVKAKVFLFHSMLDKQVVYEAAKLMTEYLQDSEIYAFETEPSLSENMMNALFGVVLGNVLEVE